MTISLKRTPTSSDGRPILMTTRFRGNVVPFFAGSADSEAGRGQGELFCIHWETAPAVAEDKHLDFSFSDWIYIAKGTVCWVNGGPGDYISFHAYAPATTVAASPGTGNCNLVPTGRGFNLITAAKGDGSHNYSDPVPVPAFTDNQPSGFWAWDEPDAGMGEVSFVGDQKSPYNLYDAEIPLVRWVAKLPMLGSAREVLHPETKARKVLPHWRFKVSVHNEALNALQVSWHLDCARKNTL